MSSVTLKKAIELTGKSKRTIQRYMANGKLSYKVNLNGHKAIDITELLRVFGDLSPPDTYDVRPNDTSDLSPHDISEQIAQAIVKAQAPLLEKISDLVDKIEHLTNRLEHKPIDVLALESESESIRATKSPKFLKPEPLKDNYLDDIPTFGKK
jgi:hypothetical protein